MGKFQSRLEKITTKHGLRPVPQPPAPHWCVIRVVQFTASVINCIPTFIIWVPTPTQGRAKAGFQSSCDIRRFVQEEPWIFLRSYCHIKGGSPCSYEYVPYQRI